MAMIEAPHIDSEIKALVQMAVREDMGTSFVDRTGVAAIPEKLRAAGTIVARTAGTVAGGFLLETILEEYAERGAWACEILKREGDRVVRGDAIARIEGPARALLSAERTLLNFLGHLSGVATMTARYVDAIADIRPTPVIVDTRKTTPGYRVLDKYAVRCGGGVNDRMGLYDGVMLKDNHLAALRGRSQETLAEVTGRIRGELEPSILLWLEVDTMEQLAEALPGGGADIILLDNFTPHQLRAAVELRNLRRDTMEGKSLPLLEASGGVTLGNVREVAATGVDRIAIGALTHSAPVLDVSMEFE